MSSALPFHGFLVVLDFCHHIFNTTFVYVEWENRDGTWTADVELDPNWQPIIIPVSVLGFRIRSKAADLHGRYQIIGMG